jgi:hypothetical protein
MKRARAACVDGWRRPSGSLAVPKILATSLAAKMLHVDYPGIWMII